MKRIDIYTIDIGGGHIAPAQALKQQFDIMGYKDLEVNVVNLGLALPMTFLRHAYKSYWDKALRYPPLINAFYRGADNPFLMKILDKAMGITYLPKFVAYIEKTKPDLVVSTYFTFTHYLETLKQVGQCDAITVMLNPEPFDSHYIWFSKAFDWSMVFSQKSYDEIIEKGMPAARVKRFQFPIKPSFSKRTETKQVLRRRLSLAQKPFTVLLFFGAEGVGPVRKFVDAIIARNLALQLVIVCGKNETLKAEMDAVARGPCGSVHIEVRGYATNLSEYIAAADIVVGKSGPNQVFETLLQERPIVISSFLANEKQTTDWVIGKKVGWLTRSPEHLSTLLAKLAAHPEIIEGYQENIRALKLRSGAPEICEFLYGLVQKTKPPRKRPMAEALRKLKERVLEESEALTKKLDESQNRRRRKSAVRKKIAHAKRAAARKTVAKALAPGPARRKTGGRRTRGA
jgi:processive 1,2-diacylglycerol beta-glucosyltransferase